MNQEWKKWCTIVWADDPNWDALGLPDFGDIADEVSYCNQREIADGQCEGFWWWIDEEKMSIVQGSFGIMNAPGASGYTHVVIYKDKDKFDSAVADYKGYPEWLED